MADVRPPRVGSADAAATDDRAQLILITGLTLAVLLVAVVLVLNTVIYTENLATRGVDAGGAEAMDFRDGAVADVAEIMSREHGSASGDSAVDDFGASTESYGRTVAELRARDGVIADVDASVEESGYFLTQNASVAAGRDMTADNGAADWTVADNATRTRNFRLTVTPEDLSDPMSGAFTVVADGTVPDGSNETWTVTLSDDGGDLRVTVDNGTVASETFPPGPDGNHTVDLTAGTFNGESFDSYYWAEGVQDESVPYRLRYEDGDAAVGTYRLVVDDRDTTSGPAPPRVAEAVYSAEVEVYHRTPELEYGDVVRVAPGERDA